MMYKAAEITRLLDEAFNEIVDEIGDPYDSNLDVGFVEGTILHAKRFHYGEMNGIIFRVYDKALDVLVHGYNGHEPVIGNAETSEIEQGVEAFILGYVHNGMKTEKQRQITPSHDTGQATSQIVQ